MAKIMIVDDALYMRRMLSDILSTEGHEIVGEAENAFAAIELYKKLRPELVTMDIIMPEVEGLNGIDAIRAIIKEDPKARIVTVSAMGQHEIVIEAIQAGSHDYIIKPFQPSNVIETVKRTLEK